MTGLMIVQPMAFAATASRGTGAANLATRDPKEVWADSAVGSAATLSMDLGAAREIDTIALIQVRQPAAAATWSVTGGLADAGEAVIAPAAALRVPDVAGVTEASACALWTGSPRTVRKLAIAVTQPVGEAPLTIGAVVVGRSWSAELGQEWGLGRRPVDTGSVTPLPSGGFAIVEGARKRLLTWTFGDLSIAEADRLEAIALALGETLPALVIEDAARTAGLRARLHYGLFRRWDAFERRNRRQTRWELGIEDWI